MRIHYFQHVPFEGLGCIEQWATTHGHDLSVTRFHLDEALPGVDEIDWLIVMGGPMNIYEEAQYPWLAPEKQFIGQAIQNGKVVIGICLGAQLIADVLGGRVTHANALQGNRMVPDRIDNRQRQPSPLFGFRLPQKLMVFHWHGDTFGAPARSSMHLAQSEAL